MTADTKNVMRKAMQLAREQLSRTVRTSAHERPVCPGYPYPAFEAGTTPLVHTYSLKQLDEYAKAIEAWARADERLNVRAEMRLVGYASSDPARCNVLLSKARFDSALPKNRTEFDVPLYALPKDAS